MTTRPTPRRPSRAGVGGNRAAAPGPTTARPHAGAVDWLLVALLCACAVLSAVLEVLFIPTYIGGTIAPFAIAGSVVGNLLLPWLANAVVPSAGGVIAPVLAWLIPVLALTLIERPEGDVLVAGGNAQQWVFYGVLLFGAAAGFVSIVRTGAGGRATAR